MPGQKMECCLQCLPYLSNAYLDWFKPVGVRGISCLLKKCDHQGFYFIELSTAKVTFGVIDGDNVWQGCYMVC